MAMDLRLHQKLDLQLKLAPQIIQSIEILQLPGIELESLVQEHLDNNEFLDLAPPDVKTVEVAPVPTPASTEPADTVDGREQEFERLERVGAFDDEMPRTKTGLNFEASDRKLEAMNNAEGREPSLHENLLEQLATVEYDRRLRPVCEAVIGHVQPNGRFEAEFQTVLDSLPAGEFTLDDVDESLGIVQSLEPRGIGARNTQECLLLQLDAKDPHFDLKYRLICRHLEDLLKNRRPKIAKALDLSLEDLDELIQELAQLDYQPGRTLVSEQAHYIYPDIIVEWTLDGYDVRLTSGNYPSLRVNPSYRKVIQSSEVAPEYKDQVRRQVDEAKWLISALEQRKQTLLRVARRIVFYQRDFLDFGPHFLKPLKMQQIADDLSIHVSTVSRATSEKYMQTHRGIFSLKSFFSGATTSVDGGVESRSSVKQRVREIIDQEDKTTPLSDEDIVSRLKQSFGVEVARRTVTKYRKALKIPSTRQRRIYS